MKRYGYTRWLFFLPALLVQFSCKKDNTKITEQRSIVDIYATINFPDTIIAGQTYRDGYIQYEHPIFDEYEEQYKGKTSRLLTFCLTVDTMKYDGFLPDDKIKDTIWSREGDIIQFFPFHIGKPGTYYLSGNIIDEIVFDTISSNKNEKLPGYRMSSFVDKKIVVLGK